jgi:hypothetical protein
MSTGATPPAFAGCSLSHLALDVPSSIAFAHDRRFDSFWLSIP